MVGRNQLGYRSLSCILALKKDSGPAPYQIGTETLASVPAGVEKVLHLRVIFLNQKHIPNEVISLAFDSKISDDDLRQIAYEEGVLRIPNFRED